MIVQGHQLHPGLAWSRIVGKVARLSLPPALLKAAVWGYARVLDVHLGEATVPDEGFSTFGEFFARSLKPGVRPVESAPGVLVSPCDGLLRVAGALTTGGKTTFEVKGRSYSATDLAGRPGWWSEIDTGGYAVIYLSPADYHRVHSPTDGTVASAWHLDGTCMPVNRLGQLVAPWSVVSNERVAFDITGPEGRVALVMVGALAVRAIEVTLPGLDLRGNGADQKVPVERGQEIAVFNLGSTVVVLWEGHSELGVQPGQRIRCGQWLAAR